jgi:hypothetical protein
MAHHVGSDLPFSQYWMFLLGSFKVPFQDVGDSRGRERAMASIAEEL